MSALSHQPPVAGHRSRPPGTGLTPTTREEQAVRDADWLGPTDDTPDADPARRARPLLLVLASIPWLVVIGLLVLPGRVGTEAGGPDPGDPSRPGATHDDHEPGTDTAPSGEAVAGDDPTPHDPAPHDPAPDDPTSDAAAPGATDPGVAGADPPGQTVTLEGRELRGRWRVEAGPEEAVSLAVVAGRAWLTGVEPVLDLGLAPRTRGDSGYAEHLIVEAVEHPASDALVVTLVAVMLDAEGGSPAVRRLAVPIAMTPKGPRLAGTPWELPPPILDRITLPRETATDEGDLDAARAALLAAGLTEPDLVALHHTGGWPVIAEVATPGTDLTHEVWLRRHHDGFVVAGTTLAGARTTTGQGAAAATTPDPDDPASDTEPDPDPVETRP